MKIFENYDVSEKKNYKWSRIVSHNNIYIIPPSILVIRYILIISYQ